MVGRLYAQHYVINLFAPRRRKQHRQAVSALKSCDFFDAEGKLLAYPLVASFSRFSEINGVYLKWLHFGNIENQEPDVSQEPFLEMIWQEEQAECIRLYVGYVAVAVKMWK